MFISLGEIMLRFCPGDMPLRTATQFTFSEGGGEYNVARALSRCFGISSGIVTALVDNELGHLVHQLIRSSAVDTSNIIWREFDGIGKEVRNPLYFAERGFGMRTPKATMDRGHSAPSQMQPDDIDWDTLFSSGKITWFHTGGIYAGLSKSTALVAEIAMRSARKHGIHVSYDPNFRGSLWKTKGGVTAAAELNLKLVEHADTLFGMEPLLDGEKPPIEDAQIEAKMRRISQQYPQLTSIVSSRRKIHSASIHDLSADLFHNGKFTKVNGYKNINVLDRIGSGDALVAGYIAGILDGLSAENSARLGCATSALTMSTPGDAVLVSRKEVEDLSSIDTLGTSSEIR